jgi:ABC-type Fe3+-hydroxamate transport system substrate-binding protein
VRVVSLVPSVTETLLDWGVDVVACTRFCEQPDLVHVGGTKDPDVAAIATLAPDLVVVDTEENRRPDHEALATAGLEVLVTSVRSMADVDGALAALAAAVGRPAPGPVAPSVRPVATATAFVPIWRHPWMTVSGATYVADVLGAVGLATAFADHADAYPTVTDDDIVAAHPDLVLAPDEPYPFAERHRAELERFGPTTIIDGKLVTWWGARTPQRLAALRALLGA